MLTQKIPYWEQSDSCHKFSSTASLKNTVKSSKGLKSSTSSSIFKKIQNTQNIQPDTAQNKLMRSTMRLKEYKLPEKYEVARVKYMDTTGRTVFNDYHSKETNPGYSRNNLGGFYTK